MAEREYPRGWVTWVTQVGGAEEMRQFLHLHRNDSWSSVWHQMRNPFWMLDLLDKSGHRNKVAMLQIVTDIALEVKDLVPEGWRSIFRRAIGLARRYERGWRVSESALEASIKSFFDLQYTPDSPINSWAVRCAQLAVQLAHTQALGVEALDWSDLRQAIEEGCIAVRFAKSKSREEWLELVSHRIRKRIPKPPRIP